MDRFYKRFLDRNGVVGPWVCLPSYPVPFWRSRLGWAGLLGLCRRRSLLGPAPRDTAQERPIQAILRPPTGHPALVRRFAGTQNDTDSGAISAYKIGVISSLSRETCPLNQAVCFGYM